MPVTRYKPNKLAHRGTRIFRTLLTPIDVTFSGSTSALTVLFSGAFGKIKALYNLGFQYNGASSVASSSYPRALFRTTDQNGKTFNAYGLGYGSGVVFWATDSQNWWAAINDVDTSQSYDTVCSTYACTTTYCTKYSYVARYGVTPCYVYACSAYTCSAYSNINFRYNSAIRIIRSISNSVSTVTSAVMSNNQAGNTGTIPLTMIQVSISGGTATVAGIDGSGNQRASTTTSGGSGTLTGFVGSPVTAGTGFTATPSITRFTVS